MTTLYRNLLISLLLTIFASDSFSQNLTYEKSKVNFFVVSDLGNASNPKIQRKVANTMGVYSEKTAPDFILLAGDCFHQKGVSSVNDTLWNVGFENMYTHPNLQVAWYPVSGNHEYTGNVNALLEYTAKSKRWNMKSFYYTFAVATPKDAIRFVLIDSTPLSKSYKSNETSNQGFISKERQIQWIDSVLNASTEKWKIVVGHHPVYSFDDKHGSTKELIKRLDPMLKKYGVDVYIGGHVHNFQHNKVPDSQVNYIVNASGAVNRPFNKSDSTLFANTGPGFTSFEIEGEKLTFTFIDQDCKELYNYSIKK